MNAQPVATNVRRRLRLSHLQITKVGAMIPDDTSYEDWLTEGRKLIAWHSDLTWAIGDMLVWGFENFGDAATEIGDMNSETLRKARQVATCIPPERRHPRLSFSHHDAVATLPPADQDDLLELAEKEGWNRNVLRDMANRRRQERDQHAIEQARPRMVAYNPPQPERHSTEFRSNVVDHAGPTFHEFDEPTPPIIDHEPETVPEPAPTGLSSDDSARRLREIAMRMHNSEGIKPLLVLLDERDKLVRVYRAAQTAIDLNQITPDLIDAVTQVA